MFLYFLPGLEAPLNGDFVLPDLTPYGLGISLADVKSSPKDATVFPVKIDGVDGALVIPHVNGTAPNVLAYKADSQTWLWVQVGDKRVGVGFNKSALPNPSSLQRDRRHDGLWVTDACGENWVVPIARGGGRNGVTLPSDYDFDPLTLQALPRPSSDFDELWGIAGHVYDHWNLNEVTLSKSVMAQYALQALAVNYRVGPLELSALAAAGKRVLNDQVAYYVCLALIDWQIGEEVKKNVMGS